ncbi:MAG TPA: hypothetical protein VGN20_10065 [Mucilaginibacter sp.]|jgi:hypothetical protein
MQTTYRLKAQAISMTFLKSLKTLFAGKEVEITVKTIEPEENDHSTRSKGLLEMINGNRKKAPVISKNIDIRGLIDDAQYPVQ